MSIKGPRGVLNNGGERRASGSIGTGLRGCVMPTVLAQISDENLLRVGFRSFRNHRDEAKNLSPYGRFCIFNFNSPHESKQCCIFPPAQVHMLPRQYLGNDNSKLFANCLWKDVSGCSEVHGQAKVFTGEHYLRVFSTVTSDPTGGALRLT